VAGLPDPYAGLDVRGWDYIYARKPKKLKDGATKFNEPNFEAVQKALIEAAASKDSGSFEVRRGHDLLTEVLGNPEHCGHVYGMCSKMSWKSVESWQSDVATYKSRQRYKEGIWQKGYDQGISEMIKSSIKEAFTSNDPKMVAMRSEMFCQVGLPVPQVQHKQMVPMIEDRPRHSIDDIKEGLHVHLLVPFGRFKKLIMGEAILHPSHEVQDFSLKQILENYVIVTVIWNVLEHEEYEMDHPTLQHVRFLGHAISHEVLWNKDVTELPNL
jgi:hypothetical protein